jgi:Mrp family chromosome partitioning ATPase
MGRMLEVLWNGEARPTQADETEQPVLCVEDGALAGGEEVPYIEIGPSRTVEGSRLVLAQPVGPQLRIVPGPPQNVPPVFEPLAPAARQTAVQISFRPLGPGMVLLSPARRLAPDLIAFHQPDHPASEQYRQIAASLRRDLTPGVTPVWFFTALAAESGTTTAVLNLGICLAQEGVRVVVVDGNLHRPALADRLGLRGKPGLAEVLCGKESLERVLQETGVANLTALTAGEGDPGRPLHALTATCRPVLRQLRDRCDVILLDGEPYDGRPSAELASVADALCVVVPEDEADTPATEDRLRALLQRGLPVRGCLVTRW